MGEKELKQLWYQAKDTSSKPSVVSCCLLYVVHGDLVSSIRNHYTGMFLEAIPKARGPTYLVG